MSYTLEDAARDEFFDQLEKELYPQHKEQAVEEFTTERLQSFYSKNPQVAATAVRSFKQAKDLFDHGFPAASFVFAVSAIEQYLKAVLLKPVAHGLIHQDSLADLIVEFTVGQTGFDRYTKLLAKLFEDLASINLDTVHREGAGQKLLDEVSELQKVRNKIIHQGLEVQDSEAENALAITGAVSAQIVFAMLSALGLQIESDGTIALSRRF